MIISKVVIISEGVELVELVEPVEPPHPTKK